MNHIAKRLHENRQIQLAKDILESNGYKVSKKLKESEVASEKDVIDQIIEATLRKFPWMKVERYDSKSKYYEVDISLEAKSEGKELDRIRSIKKEDILELADELSDILQIDNPVKLETFPQDSDEGYTLPETMSVHFGDAGGPYLANSNGTAHISTEDIGWLRRGIDVRFRVHVLIHVKNRDVNRAKKVDHPTVASWIDDMPIDDDTYNRLESVCAVLGADDWDVYFSNENMDTWDDAPKYTSEKSIDIPGHDDLVASIGTVEGGRKAIYTRYYGDESLFWLG